MDFYNTIKNLDLNQIKELVSLKIAEARYHSYYTSRRFIGVDCDINPSVTLNGEKELDSQAMWNGFIPEDVKLIYSFVPNEDGYTVNNGCYYYIDDDEYLYQFAEYISKKNISNELDFLTNVLSFVDNYFNDIKTNNIHRQQMHSPLMTQDGRFIEPKKHRFLDFKGANNAECSEYSAMVQNILSIFGFYTLYFTGSIASNYANGGHAFNFTFVNGMPCVLDFALPVEVYSLDGVVKDKVPFIGVVNSFNNNILKKHIFEQIPFDFADYYYLEMNNQLMMVSSGKERHYIVGNVEYYNEKKKVK